MKDTAISFVRFFSSFFFCFFRVCQGEEREMTVSRERDDGGLNQDVKWVVFNFWILFLNFWVE